MQILNIGKMLNFTVVAMATISISIATRNALLCRTFIPDHISYRFAIGTDNLSYRKNNDNTLAYCPCMSHYPHLSQFNQWKPQISVWTSKITKCAGHNGQIWHDFQMSSRDQSTCWILRTSRELIGRTRFLFTCVAGQFG